MTTDFKNPPPPVPVDILAKANQLLTLAKSGTFTINEIRALVGVSPIDGGDKFPVVSGEEGSIK